MRVNHKAVGLLLIAAGAIVAGVYVNDDRQEIRSSDIAGKPKAASTQGLTPVPQSRLPPSHPPVAVAQPGAQAREGKVQLDPARAYTHFRVGNNSVIAIYADGAAMWLGTSGGIVRYDAVTREFKTYDVRDGLLENGILYLGRLQGKIAAGTNGGGLSLFNKDAQKWDRFDIPKGLGDGFVYDALEVSGGDLWIATGAGVNRVRGGALKERAKWNLYNVKNTGGGLPHDRVYRIVEGRDRSIWFATRGGLANYRNGKWTSWTHAQGLGAPQPVLKTAADKDLARPATRNAEQAQAAQAANAGVAFNPNHIAALEVDKNGMVWAGTRGGGLARFDGKAWTNYTVADGLPSNHISTLNFDRNGQLWVGTKSGLAYFKDGKFRVMTTANGLLAENVLAVTITKAGEMWVGGFGGVAHFRQPALN